MITALLTSTELTETIAEVSREKTGLEEDLALLHRAVDVIERRDCFGDTISEECLGRIEALIVDLDGDRRHLADEYRRLTDYVRRVS